MKREIRYFVIVEDGPEMEILKAYGYREAITMRKQIKQDRPGVVCRIEMR